MKDKEFDSVENSICHLVDVAGSVNSTDAARFKLECTKIHALAALLLARVIQERPFNGKGE